MITLTLDQPRDISYLLSLAKECPHDITLLICRFSKSSTIKYNKKKGMRKFLNKQDFQNTINVCKLHNIKYITIKSYLIYRWVMRKSVLHLTRGSDFVSFGPLANHTLILSGNRAYLNRILEISLRKGIDIKRFTIQLNSKEWLTNKNIQNFSLDNAQNPLDLNRLQFSFFDFQSTIPENFNKTKIINENNEKIVLCSYRQAEPDFSVFKNSNDFFSTFKGNLENFKKEKFKVIIRRRLSVHDIETYKVTKSPEISRFEELKNLYDEEQSFNDGFPSTLFKTLTKTDLIFAGDVTGLISTEGLIFKIPIILPNFKNLKNNEKVNAVLKDMIENNLIFNDLRDYYNTDKLKLSKRFDKVKQKWYNGNSNEFFKKISNLSKGKQ